MYFACNTINESVLLKKVQPQFSFYEILDAKQRFLLFLFFFSLTYILFIYFIFFK